MIRHFILCVSMLNIFGVGVTNNAVGDNLNKSKLPNLVVFISDDMGIFETPVYAKTQVKTPTMEMLAANGMTFENAYVASPSCCPNRYSLQTGLMPARHGAHPNHSLVKPGTEFLLPRLQKLGYKVISFGKVAHSRKVMPGVDHLSAKSTDMSKDVEKWFRDNKETSAPVCLLVGDRRPHVEWTEEKLYNDEKISLPPYFIDTPVTRDHWNRYMTDITRMDEEMGRIHKIAQKQFGEDFVFMFTSDHGGQWPRGKWNLYDIGARVPLIVSWKGHVQSKTRTDAMVSWVDLIPTLMDIAGGNVPKDIDGRSFKNVLLGKTNTHRDKIFTTHTGDGAMNRYPMRSVRIGNYKYIHNLCPDCWHTNHSDRLGDRDGASRYWPEWYEAAKTDKRAASIVENYHTRPEFELYNLENDKFELNNLVNEESEKKRLNAMKLELKKWTTAQGDELQPHDEPYLRSKPIPTITMNRKKKSKKNRKPKTKK